MSPPSSAAPWQFEHSRWYDAAPRLTCSSVKTPSQTVEPADCANVTTTSATHAITSDQTSPNLQHPTPKPCFLGVGN